MNSLILCLPSEYNCEILGEGQESANYWRQAATGGAPHARICMHMPMAQVRHDTMMPAALLPHLSCGFWAVRSAGSGGMKANQGPACQLLQNGQLPAALLALPATVQAASK